MATSNEAGGCETIRNGSRYIERYEWISDGYETFNTRYDAFVVGKCLRHEYCQPKPYRTVAEVQALKLSLAQLYCDNVPSYSGGVTRKFGGSSLGNKTSSVGYR